jgi:hypothetical protein
MDADFAKDIEAAIASETPIERASLPRPNTYKNCVQNVPPGT